MDSSRASFWWMIYVCFFPLSLSLSPMRINGLWYGTRTIGELDLFSLSHCCAGSPRERPRVTPAPRVDIAEPNNSSSVTEPKKNNKNLVVMDEPPPQKKNNKLIEPRSTQSIIDGQREKSQMVRFSQKFLDVCFQNAFARCQHTLARSWIIHAFKKIKSGF